MRRISSTQRSWLKSLHILFVAIWIGAGFSMLMLIVPNNSSVGEIYATWLSIKRIDVFLVAIPNALTLTTGLLITWLGGWGFKPTWVKVKLFFNLSIVIFGSLFAKGMVLRPLVILRSGQLAALQNPVFLLNKQMLLYSTMVIEILLFAVVVISVMKPWRKKQT